MLELNLIPVRNVTTHDVEYVFAALKLLLKIADGKPLHLQVERSWKTQIKLEELACMFSALSIIVVIEGCQ